MTAGAPRPTARYREQLAIQQRNLVDNGRGGRKRPDGDDRDWIDVAGNVAAEVLPLRGDEALQNAVLRAVQIYRVTIRARSGLTPDLRLFWRGQAMNIKTIAWSDDRREIVMTCATGEAAA